MMSAATGFGIGMSGALPSLADKVIMVTEAGARFADGPGVTGPGEAFAALAAGAGAHLVLVDREAARLAATRARVSRDGCRVVTVVADLADPAATAGALAACRATFGRLDALVGHLVPGGPFPASPPGSNGPWYPDGVAIDRSGDDGAPREWVEDLPAPGLRRAGVVRLSRSAAELMGRHGGGAVLNFACAPICQQRRAQEAAARLNRVLLAELGWQGIRSNAVTTLPPGPDFLLPAAPGSWLRTRTAAIWHAARGALYLASDHTRTLSGSVLTPDDPVPFAL